MLMLSSIENNIVSRKTYLEKDSLCNTAGPYCCWYRSTSFSRSPSWCTGICCRLMKFLSHFDILALIKDEIDEHNEYRRWCKVNLERRGTLKSQPWATEHNWTTLWLLDGLFFHSALLWRRDREVEPFWLVQAPWYPPVKWHAHCLNF